MARLGVVAVLCPQRAAAGPCTPARVPVVCTVRTEGETVVSRPFDAAPVRIGVLGAAAILSNALIEPARGVPGVDVVAVAARDRVKAQKAAAKHHIATVHGRYEDLLADPGIDAVYIPLPAALHAEWAIAAIQAGKHVLVEKPFTSNVFDAERVAGIAAVSDVVVMEAYHTGHHPFTARVAEIIASGEIGTVTHARAVLLASIPSGSDIRWNRDLGGGALLDVGYYPVRMLRDLFGAAPRVQSARAWMRRGVDRRMVAELDFGAGVHAEVATSMLARRTGASLVVRGDAGELRVSSPYAPQHGAKVKIKGRRGQRVESADRRASYSFQLEAFRDAITRGSANATNVTAAVAQMRTLEAIYAAAGIGPLP